MRSYHRTALLACFILGTCSSTQAKDWLIFNVNKKSIDGNTFQHPFFSAWQLKFCRAKGLNPFIILPLTAVSKEVIYDKFIRGDKPDFIDAITLASGLLLVGQEHRIAFRFSGNVAYQVKNSWSAEFSALQIRLNSQVFVSNEVAVSTDKKMYWGMSLNYLVYGNIYVGLGANLRRIVQDNGYPISEHALDPKIVIGLALVDLN